MISDLTKRHRGTPTKVNPYPFCKVIRHYSDSTVTSVSGRPYKIWSTVIGPSGFDTLKMWKIRINRTGDTENVLSRLQPLPPIGLEAETLGPPSSTCVPSPPNLLVGLPTCLNRVGTRLPGEQVMSEYRKWWPSSSHTFTTGNRRLKYSDRDGSTDPSVVHPGLGSCGSRPFPYTGMRVRFPHSLERTLVKEKEKEETLPVFLLTYLRPET